MVQTEAVDDVTEVTPSPFVVTEARNASPYDGLAGMFATVGVVGTSRAADESQLRPVVPPQSCMLESTWGPKLVPLNTVQAR
jgi:hypothetical protein